MVHVMDNLRKHIPIPANRTTINIIMTIMMLMPLEDSAFSSDESSTEMHIF